MSRNSTPKSAASPAPPDAPPKLNRGSTDGALPRLSQTGYYGRISLYGRDRDDSSSAALTLSRSMAPLDLENRGESLLPADDHEDDNQTAPLLRPHGSQPPHSGNADSGGDPGAPPDSHDSGGYGDPKLERRLSIAYTVSWLVNIFLFVSKAYAWHISRSSAVLASLADSFVDLVSQVVIFCAESQSKKRSPSYPVGQARLETIGVLACACIMSVCSFEVVKEGAMSLWSGFVEGDLPFLDTSLIMYSVLGAATALKLACYILCAALQSKSDSMEALAEDHLNDIMSNAVAIITAGVAGRWKRVWYLDPVGGILISLYIVWRWAAIAKSQVEKVVGKAAPPEFVQHLNDMINTHHDSMTVDTIRAYHSGARFLVEVEVVMPEHTLLKHVHDVSLELQNKLELLEEVERAFVHVDYAFRSEPEHKMERRLMGLTPVLSHSDSDPLVEDLATSDSIRATENHSSPAGPAAEDAV